MIAYKRTFSIWNSIIHFKTWSGEKDAFFIGIIHSWLQGLFLSNIEVLLYVELNPLPNEQSHVEKSSKLTKYIVRDMKY